MIFLADRVRPFFVVVSGESHTDTAPEGGTVRFTSKPSLRVLPKNTSTPGFINQGICFHTKWHPIHASPIHQALLRLLDSVGERGVCDCLLSQVTGVLKNAADKILKGFFWLWTHFVLGCDFYVLAIVRRLRVFSR